MTDIFIENVIWDRWNLRHIGKHGVVKEEVEEVLLNEPVFVTTYKDRVMAIGLTKKQRMLSIVLGYDGNNSYYPITARNSTNKEITKYKIEKGI